MHARTHPGREACYAGAMASNGPSEHLSWEELACHDGTPYPDRWRASRAVFLATEFEGIRALIGWPLAILSAYRTPEHNRRVGGARASQHVEGRALDLAVGQGSDRTRLIRLWAACRERAKSHARIRGLGLYPWGVHIDTRPGPRLVVWSGSRELAELVKS